MDHPVSFKLVLPCPLKTGGGKRSQQVAEETSDFNVSKNLFEIDRKTHVAFFSIFSSKKEGSSCSSLTNFRKAFVYSFEKGQKIHKKDFIHLLETLLTPF